MDKNNVPDNVALDPHTGESSTASEEELEWSALKGSTQDRVREVVKAKNQTLKENTELKNKLLEFETKLNALKTTPPPAPTVDDGTITPQQQQALNTLKKFGVVTREDLQAVKDQQILDSEYNRLEEKFSGEDGRPTFSRAEVEKHMRESGIYNPEKAYKDLYEEELFNWRLKQSQDNTEQPKNYTLKPTGGTSKGDAPLSVDSIRERMQKPDGRIWWEKNRTKLLPLLGELSK